jgi:hypothetical protein
MKKSLSMIVVAASFCLATGLVAQERDGRAKNLGEVETKWPGIILAISRIERIQDNRVLVFVRVIASSKSGSSGRSLRLSEPVPAGARQEGVSQEGSRPFSLRSTVMIDDQTQQKYNVLPPIAPPGKKYLPAGFSNVLLPGEARTVSIQFTAPPAPPLIKGREPPKQTVSFLLTGAKGPITRVPIPPPGAE